jgi:hypothetical protein
MWFVTPFQGSNSTSTSATQGAALGCIVVPFQGNERSTAIVTKPLNFSIVLAITLQ